MAAAKRAQRAWVSLTVDRRRDLLIDLADLVHEHLDELAELNVRDYAVPISYAGTSMLLERFLRHYAGYVDKPLGASTPVNGSFDINLIEREPMVSWPSSRVERGGACCRGVLRRSRTCRRKCGRVQAI